VNSDGQNHQADGVGGDRRGLSAPGASGKAAPSRVRTLPGAAADARQLSPLPPGQWWPAVTQHPAADRAPARHGDRWHAGRALSLKRVTSGRFSPRPGARLSGGRPEPVKGAPSSRPFGQTLDRTAAVSPPDPIAPVGLRGGAEKARAAITLRYGGLRGSVVRRT
jgi:hypothetical protein